MNVTGGAVFSCHSPSAIGIDFRPQTTVPVSVRSPPAPGVTSHSIIYRVWYTVAINGLVAQYKNKNLLKTLHDFFVQLKTLNYVVLKQELYR